jgi:glycosyltransferase involved in cell wall biosynthesis
MKFSIGIPVYKATFLKECIKSVLSQSYRDLEIVIVDDASPEDIDSVVASFADERMHFYRNKKNCGAENVVDNWNKCLSYAQGDYFILMGDDDMLAPDCLEQYITLMSKYPGLGIYHARTWIINEDSEVIELQEARPEYESVYSMIWHRIKGGRVQFIGDFCFETSNLRKNGGYYKIPLAWGSDDISSYIACSKNGIANTFKPVFFYRKNIFSISHIGNAQLKMKGACMGCTWIGQFVNTTVPDNELDKQIVVLIKNNLARYLIKNKVYIIANAVYKNGLISIFGWLIMRKKYQLSLSMIVGALFEAIKLKKTLKI